MNASFSRREAIMAAAANLAFATASPGRESSRIPRNDPRTFDVVFEGGGIKGAGLAGALEVLEEEKSVYRHLIGTSAGAILATLTAAGFRAADLRKTLVERDPTTGRHVFASFLRPPETILAPPPSVDEQPKTATDRFKRRAFETTWETATKGLLGACELFRPIAFLNPKFAPERMQERVGWGFALLSAGAAASDKGFLDWLDQQFQKVHIDRDITLEAFHAKTSGRGQLSLLATDVTGKKSLVLNHRTAPRVPVRWAVRMSMGIPLVWPEVEWLSEWGTYRTNPMTDEQGGHRIVDGGVLSNFPLRYLIEARHRAPDGILGPFRAEVAATTLGLLLDESQDVPGSSPREERKRLAEKVAAYQSVTRLVETMTGAWDQDILDAPENKPFLCRIPVKGYDTLDFDMAPERMDLLVKSGKDAMRGHLNRPA